jgi:hypothetical protein
MIIKQQTDNPIYDDMTYDSFFVILLNKLIHN